MATKYGWRLVLFGSQFPTCGWLYLLGCQRDFFLGGDVDACKRSMRGSGACVDQVHLLDFDEVLDIFKDKKHHIQL